MADPEFDREVLDRLEEERVRGWSWKERCAWSGGAEWARRWFHEHGLLSQGAGTPLPPVRFEEEPDA